MTSRNLDGNSFIMTPPFSPSAIWAESWGSICLQGGLGQAFGLVVRLHLGHQLGVTALGLDNGGDALGLAL